MELSLGRELASGLSEAELRAGVAFLSRPDITAAAGDYAKAPKGKEDSRVLDKASAEFERTPEGRAFAARMDKIDLDATGKEMLRDIGKRIVERFRAKLAAEGLVKTPS
jgi:hypothetical protein